MTLIMLKAPLTSKSNQPISQPTKFKFPIPCASSVTLHIAVNVLGFWKVLTTIYLCKTCNYNNKMKQANVHSKMNSEP